MLMRRGLLVVVVAFRLSIAVVLFGASWDLLAGGTIEAVDTLSDTWVATDGLGRTLPTAAEVGPPKANRTVAIFYFLWHSNASSNPSLRGPFDVSKMLARDPDLLQHPQSSLFGPWGCFHHWGEPLLGYYVADKAVYKRHAQWLSDAGVDGIFFDVSNGPIYEENFMTLIEAFAEHEAAGGKAPKIAFLCPFSPVPAAPPDRHGTVVRRLWEKLYKPKIHPELWFRWEGKPLILSYPSYCEGEPLLRLNAIGDERRADKARVPVRLEKGHVLGQRFEVAKPFVEVQVSTPTYHSPTMCGAKLVLRREGPSGAVVGSCVADAIADNALTTLRLSSPAPAGAYLIELCEPVGTVGWWSRQTDAHQGAYLDGRPVAGFRHLLVRAADPEADRMKDFFTFREPTSGGGYHHVKKGNDGAWMWAESYPQPMHRGPDGQDEMVSVSVALNATATKGPVPMNCGEGVMGRRWHKGANDPDSAGIAKGLCFQEQWDRALELDPPLVFVTGWNEWIMVRIRNWAGWEIPAGNFVDQYSPEFSRDVEPVRGHWGDAFYWQLAANVRRFKGVRPIPPVVSAAVAIDGDFADWAAVAPEFRDDAGDPMRRDAAGWGKAGPYVDKTGRNDIVLAKTSRLGDGIAFYVKTREPLTPPADDWMRLFVDSDRNASTGWLGYDFLIERVNGKTVLRAQNAVAGEFSWSEPLVEATCAIGACEMELMVPIAAFGTAFRPDGFDFKWEDNCLQERDWTDLLLRGDTAPNARFNYRAIFLSD